MIRFDGRSTLKLQAGDDSRAVKPDQKINAKDTFRSFGLNRVQTLSDRTGELAEQVSSAFAPQRAYATLAA